MKFLIALLAFTLITLVMSSPLPDKQNSDVKNPDQNGDNSSKSSSSGTSSSANANSNTSTKKQTNSKAAATQGGASVLKSQPYSELQISDGKAGNAEQEAAAKFQGLDTGDLSKVSDADVNLLNGIHEIAEKAEVEGFIPTIAKASGDEAKALQIGMIKNKVLKLSALVLVLEIQTAKGQNIDPSKLTAEKTKKAKNIQLDTAAKGQASKSVTVNGSS